MHLLIGSTFPLSLIRAPVRIVPSSLDELRERLPGAESPDYTPGFRPAIGEEVTPEQISGWQILRLFWP